MFEPGFSQTLAAAQARLSGIDIEHLRRSGLVRDSRDYYLLATYPPIKAMDPAAPDQVFHDTRGHHRVYVHIPFCEQYCTFCHYTKEINPGSGRVTTYLDALHREIDTVADRFGGRIPTYSLFFGGGTPSYLSPRELDGLFQHLRSRLDIHPDADIAFELHPGVIRQADYEDRIKVLKSHGVSRWVFGVQSMDEQVLRKLNRGHGRQEVHGLLDILHRHGCTDVSVDLIFGLPFQTAENWYSSVRELLSAGVSKFNVFPLMFKPSDPITRHYRRQPDIFPNGETRLLMHFMIEEMLFANGFRKGPITYYSKGNRRYPTLREASAHERIEGLGLVGLGVSAFGYLGGTQYFNLCDMDAYIRTAKEGHVPVWLGHTLSDEERMRRALMFGLRSRGLLRSDFKDKFGSDPRERFSGEFAVLEKFGLLSDDEEEIRLSPRGEIDASGVSSIFCSIEVRDRIRAANEAAKGVTGRMDRELLEMHDFSPIEHVGVSGLQ